MIGKNRLMPYQAFFVLIHAQVGIGIISMPYEVFLQAKTDSWISVLLTGIVVQLVIFLFAMIMKMYPDDTFQQLIKRLFGKWVANFIFFLYGLYFLFLSSMLLATYANTVSTWMMPLTPRWILIILMICIVIYGVSAGLQIMARFFLLASFIFVIYFLFACYALKDASLTFILPIGSSGIKGILAGIKPAFSSFQGYELILLMYPFIAGKTKVKVKLASFANLFVTLFYTFIVFVTIVFLSEEEIVLTPEPLLYLVKSFTFRIIERPDLLFTSIWLVLVATTIMVVFFHANLVVHFLVKDEGSQRTIYILAFIVFLISIMPTGLYEVNKWMNIFKPFIFVSAVCMPVLYTLIALIRRRMGGKS